MNDAILISDMGHEHTRELRASGCRRCVRTRSRWITSEFRRLRDSN